MVSEIEKTYEKLIVLFKKHNETELISLNFFYLRQICDVIIENQTILFFYFKLYSLFRYQMEKLKILYEKYRENSLFVWISNTIHTEMILIFDYFSIKYYKTPSDREILEIIRGLNGYHLNLLKKVINKQYLYYYSGILIDFINKIANSTDIECFSENSTGNFPEEYHSENWHSGEWLKYIGNMKYEIYYITEKLILDPTSF